MAMAYATARFCLFLTFLNLISLGLAGDPGNAQARPLATRRAAIRRCGSVEGMVTGPIAITRSNLSVGQSFPALAQRQHGPFI